MRTSNILRAVYHSDAIRAWEKRWFLKNNSSYGLMQQAALAITIQIEKIIFEKKLSSPKILVWCGFGNNAGDGYLVAKYLKMSDFDVNIYAEKKPLTLDAQTAYAEVIDSQIPIHIEMPHNHFNLHIDALYGIGLNRELDRSSQNLIDQFNACDGLKFAIDIPSGLCGNTGIPLPIAINADFTLSVIGLKLGTLIGKAQEHVGQLIELPLIPIDSELTPSAYISYCYPKLPSRQATQHKGSFGHVLVIGGHANMGGAVIMSGEAAMASGAGKVTMMCDSKHHMAVLARSPNIMISDIDQQSAISLSEFFDQIDVICIGMGLGRDAWAETHFQHIMNVLKQKKHLHSVVLDADALWFLAKDNQIVKLEDSWVATPHAGEAARLLNCSIMDIENDRIAAIQQLQQNYGGQWVLKGAGSLTLENERLDICAFGNEGMGTAGMGDILSGLIAGLKVQFQNNVSIADIVALHALAGDVLAQNGMRGIQAQDMVKAIYQVVNS